MALRWRNLWGHDQARHPDRCVIAVRRCEIFANDRQHRRIGKLEKNDRRGEQNKLPVFGKGENGEVETADPSCRRHGQFQPPLIPTQSCAKRISVLAVC